MFITITRSGYNRDSEQVAAGLFLILTTAERHGPTISAIPTMRDEQGRLAMRAFVRHVRMHQCGYFMMARTRIGSYKCPLSGSYGGDGLPRTVPFEVWERGVAVPGELVDLWNKGGGHNSAGSEIPAIQKWALANLKALRAAK